MSAAKILALAEQALADGDEELAAEHLAAYADQQAENPDASLPENDPAFEDLWRRVVDNLLC